MLSRAATLPAGLHPEEDSFVAIAESFAGLAPSDTILVSSYDPITDATRVRALIAPAEAKAKVEALMGRGMVGLTLKTGEETIQELREGRLKRIAGGLYQLTFQRLPMELCRQLEAALEIRACFALPLIRSGALLGMVAILSRSELQPQSTAMEALASLAAIVIHRRRAEQQLYESEKRFRLLAENSQDIVFRLRLRPGRGFEYISPAVKRILGYAPERFYADPTFIDQLLLSEDRATFWGAVQRPTHEPLAVRLQRADGCIVWLELMTTTAAMDGLSDGLAAVEGSARDVTERKRIEEVLRETDRRKDEFLAILSHELRNPLAPITNGLYVLEKATPLDERAKRATAVIGRQVGYLTRLIEDLLDVTRIARGKIRVQRSPLELNELVRRTAEDQSAVFADRQITLQLDITGEPLWVEADGTRIAQAFGNLLNNALKFTPPDGKVIVRVAEEADSAVLQVIDNGIGIEPDMLQRLFLPFAQADRAVDRSRGGLGLGLALVKGLVELHGGTVVAESGGKGQGACFTIRLQRRSAPDSGRAFPPLHKSAHPRRVLVIEDNRDSADTLREALEMVGHEVRVAYSGSAGIQQARESKPDVILCDIGLPGLSGYDVARAIRADPALSSVYLVALSGYALPDDRRRAAEAGFQSHVAKPPAIEVLEGIIEAAPRPA